MKKDRAMVPPPDMPSEQKPGASEYGLLQSRATKGSREVGAAG